jgi:hypothetical protein
MFFLLVSDLIFNLNDSIKNNNNNNLKKEIKKDEIDSPQSSSRSYGLFSFSFLFISNIHFI